MPRARLPGRRPWWRRPTLASAPPAVVVTTLVGVVTAPAAAAPRPSKPAPMPTPWTDRVPVDSPLPEYPRPRLTRPDRAHLNGIRNSAVTGRDAGQPSAFPDRIRVPFVAQSALSGIQRRIAENDKPWYKHAFTVPPGWNGRRVALNFGASDWQTTVWGNGTQAGAHAGGYDAFAYDITPQFNGGTNTVVVSAYGPSRTGGQAVGKQRVNDVEPHPGGGIFHTPASGIRQTVRLEPVAASHTTRLDMTPHLGSRTLRAKVHAAVSAGRSARVTVSSGGSGVGTATGAAGAELPVPVPNPRLWSPGDPPLYDVRAGLLGGSAVVDSAGSCTGMRSIAAAKAGSILRPVLKNGATWCAVPGTGGVRLSSTGFPGSHLRHIDRRCAWPPLAGPRSGQPGHLHGGHHVGRGGALGPLP